MIAVIFELLPRTGQRKNYLDLAADLRPVLEEIPGFLSIERFQSLQDPDKVLSLSFWQDEASISTWRNLEIHRSAQQAGRSGILADYRLRVAQVKRDYGMADRVDTPSDSQRFHGSGGEAHS